MNDEAKEVRGNESPLSGGGAACSKDLDQIVKDSFLMIKKKVWDV